MRGGFTLPLPTPRMPLKPPSASCFSFQILHVSPTCLAIAWASRAISAGGMSPAGMFTRSRAHETASTRVAACFTAAFSGLASHRAGPTAVMRRRSLPSAFFVRYRSKR